MKAPKKIGIWLDHTEAHVIEYNAEDVGAKEIKSHIKGLDKQEGRQHSEGLLHEKENQNIRAYYEDIIELVKNYDEVLLFGPTDAKNELHNLIRKTHHYDHIKIETKSADKMSAAEEHAFVVNHFKNLLNYDSPFNK